MPKSAILFRLTDSALIVANTGMPFSRIGVVSVCFMNLGTKQEEEECPEDQWKHASDCELVDAIAESCANDYKNMINNMKADAKREEEVKKGYANRFVWELLQNADDVATECGLDSGKFIGAKGLGFKSVLDISKTPEIYSNAFQFGFSQEDTRAFLERKKVKIKNYRIPAFRVPHRRNPDEECRQLLNHYSTVIRLPWRNDAARDKARKLLSDLRATCLLFCQRLERITIESDCRREFEIDRGGKFGLEQEKSTVTLKETGPVGFVQKWRRWSAIYPSDDESNKQLKSVAICLPVGKSNNETALSKEPSLHVFFPTDEKISGCKALFHVSYELDVYRKRLSNSQKNGESIRGHIRRLLEKILEDIPPSVSLAAFGECKMSEIASDETELIENDIAEIVRNTAFIPVLGTGPRKVVSPVNARLWRHGLGGVVRRDCEQIRDANLAMPSLTAKLENDGARIILATLGGQWIDSPESEPVEHAKLLRSCKNETFQQCTSSMLCAGRIMSEALDRHWSKAANPGIFSLNKTVTPIPRASGILRETPFWRTEKGNARGLHTSPPLLRARPHDWPSWLSVNVDVLDPHFSKILDNEKAAVLKKSGVWPFDNPADMFAGIVLPFCAQQEDKWWETAGHEVLRLTRRWGASMLKNNKREDIGAIVRLPTNKGWIPAAKCYAGEAWGGLACFDRCADKLLGVIAPPDSGRWKNMIGEEKTEWNEMFFHLGVSRLPKLLDGRFDETALDALTTETSPKIILTILQELYNEASTLGAIQQLKESKLIPCKPCVLYPNEGFLRPDQAYMPRKGLRGLLPEVKRDGISDNEWHKRIEACLIQLGVNQKLPENPEKFHQWMKDLNNRAENMNKSSPDFSWLPSDNDKRGIIGIAANAIFTHYRQKSLRKIPAEIPVPYLRKTDSGEFVDFAPAADVCWADKHYFDQKEIRDIILNRHKKGINVFFHFLDDGKFAELSPLSEKLKLEVRLGTEAPEKSQMLADRFMRRKNILESACKCKFPQNLCIIAHEGIRLVSRLDADIHPEIDSWTDYESDILCVNVWDSESQQWEALSEGLARVSKNMALKPHIEVFLKEQDRERCLARLRKEPYSLTEESLRAIPPETLDEPIQPPKPDGPDGPDTPSGPGTPSGPDMPNPPRPHPDKIKDIEIAAMNAVMEHFKKDGFLPVDDSHRKLGWDITIYDDARTIFLRVEVKGKEGGGMDIQLTPNEYRISNDHKDTFRLAIVRNALTNPICAIYARGSDDDNGWDWMRGDDKHSPQRLITKRNETISVEYWVKPVKN